MPPIYEATEDLGIPPTPKGTRLELTKAQAKPYGKSLKLIKDKKAEATKVEATDPAAEAEKAQAEAAAAKLAEEEKIAAEEAAALEKAEEDRKAAAASEAEMAGLTDEEREAKGQEITEAAQKKAEEEKKAAAAAKAKEAEEAKKAEEAKREENEGDDLTKIKGISANRQTELNGRDIFTYQQLIAADPVNVAMLIKGANAGTVRGWQDQAKELAKE